MVPGFLDTSWKALDNQAGLEDSEVSGGAAHHERLVLYTTWAIEMLSEAISRQIRETFRGTSKGFFISFSCLSTFL